VLLLIYLKLKLSNNCEHKTFKNVFSVLFLGWVNSLLYSFSLTTRPQKITTSAYIFILRRKIGKKKMLTFWDLISIFLTFSSKESENKLIYDDSKSESICLWHFKIPSNLILSLLLLFLFLLFLLLLLLLLRNKLNEFHSNVFFNKSSQPFSHGNSNFVKFPFPTKLMFFP